MDRRTVWAILLMMVIAIAPAIFMKKPSTRGAAGQNGSGADTAALSSSPVLDTVGPTTARDTTRAPAPRAPGEASDRPAAPLPSSPTDDTVHVTSPLYHYGISTRGGRLVEATLPRYRSMAPGQQGRPARLLPENSRLLGLTLVLGRDTIPLQDWPFTVSAESLDVKAPTSLRLSGARNGVSVDLTYTFRPDDYQIGVSGRVSGVGPNGGLVRVGMGPTLANTEADSNENHRALALITKHDETERTDFSGLKAGEPKTVSGPLEWAAIKSKYFVTAVLALDSAQGGISGVTAVAPPAMAGRPSAALVDLSLPLPPSGDFQLHDVCRADGDG